ncbi:hypothetical protein [Asticcacaulis taihuensis]|uniref:hypothetical protein n=1 Tax=Asticcacaulis taihuensis TaxID=260084 RepID=UPI0026E9916F|nr:hypothetical protein [Asticcacaulis taihuensis]
MLHIILAIIATFFLVIGAAALVNSTADRMHDKYAPWGLVICLACIVLIGFAVWVR